MVRKDPSRKGANDRQLSEDRTPIIQTKLHRPPLTEQLVCRKRLNEHMDHGLETPLTVVSAPAGYGKSTLVSQWADSLDLPCAWLSLDSDDSDLAEFTEYVLAAVETAFPDACPNTKTILNAPNLAPTPVLGACMINELDAIASPFVLVLDDYHRISQASEVHRLVDFLLEHPPRPLRLVIATRRDPPLQMASMRAGGKVTEVRLDELRFTEAETTELLEGTTDVVIGHSAITNLQLQVEGWAAGLHLVSLALRRAEDPDAFLGNLHGGLPHTQEYLVREVLDGLPPEVRDCLMKASILDRFCPELVTVVSGHGPASSPPVSGGRDLVSFLLERNLFTISLDVDGEWFRFHHLFQDLMQRHLNRQISADEIAALHLRASEWLESRGLLEESVTHALLAENPARATEIVLARRYDLLNSDRWSFTEKLLSRLPSEIRESDAGLLLMQAWIAFWRWELENMMAFVERAGALLDDETEGPASLRGELDFFNGQVAYWTGETEKSRKLLDGALKGLGGVGGIVEGNVEIMLGLARRITGDGEMAIQALENLIRTAGADESALISQLLAAQVFVHLTTGDLAAAQICSRQITTHAQREGMSNTVAWAHYFIAYAHFEAQDLCKAIEAFNEMNRHRYVLEPKAVADGLTGLAIAYQLSGDPKNAKKTAESLMNWAIEVGAPELLEVATSCRARLGVLRGEPETAVAWAETIRDAPELSDLFMWLEVSSITKARVLVALGSRQSLDSAAELLDTIRERSEKWRFDCHTIETTVLKAVVLKKQGHREEAMTELENALSLAAPVGWVRPFVEAGPLMAEMLEGLGPDDPNHGFVQRLLAAVKPTEPGQSIDCDSDANRPTSITESALDALTDRELDILELLQQRLYNKEIASKLCISTHTVNYHLKHIYSKLAVNTRRQAVRCALERGILNPTD